LVTSYGEFAGLNYRGIVISAEEPTVRKWPTVATPHSIQKESP